MRLVSALLLAASAAVSALASGPAGAQIRIYCCDDASGRKVCGDYLPPVCQNRAHEERDSQGRVSKRVEAPLTAEQQARRAAELAKKDTEKKKALEDSRRTLALMSTYASEKDIDNARDRALREVEKTLAQAQQRLAEANKKQKKLDGEKEFYKGKPLPAQLKVQFADNDSEIKAHTETVAAKTREIEEIRAKFASEKARYLELTGKKPADGAAPASEATTPASTPAAPPAASPATANAAAKK